MQDRLKEFLVKAASVPFNFGEWDCAMTLANWVREQTGIDPAPDLRGTYQTDEEWKAIVEAAGGMVYLVRCLALKAGLVPIVYPQRGDIGVIEVPRLGDVGAIFSGTRWVCKLRRGVYGGSTQFYVAWGLR